MFPKREKAKPKTYEEVLEIEQREKRAEASEIGRFEYDNDPSPLDTLNASILAGMDPNTKNSEGITPIHYAALHGHSVCIEPLVNVGAQLNSRDLHHDTALHISAEYGDLKTMAQLVKFGADVNLENEDGNTPLMISMFEGNLAGVDLLLDAGALIEKTNIRGNPGPDQEECILRINDYFEEIMITVEPEDAQA